MGIFEHFPYTNFHNLNLDWIMEKITSIEDKLETYIDINQLHFADPITWDITASYPIYTIVIDSNYNGYVSTQAVPPGIALDNDTFWTPIFVYDQQTITPNPVSILTLGGRNDGSTDVGQIINDNSDKAIYFPCGTYLIETPVTVTGKLIGAGYSRYQFDDPESCTVIKSNIYGGNLFTLSGNATIENMNIICIGQETAIGSEAGLFAIKDISISNLGGIGIKLESESNNSRQGFIDNITIHGKQMAESTGIRLDNLTIDNRITNVEMMGVQKGIVQTRGMVYTSNLHIWTISSQMTADWFTNTVGLDVTGYFYGTNIYLDCNFRGIIARGTSLVDISNLFTYGDSSQGAGINVTGQRAFTREGGAARFNIVNYFAFVSDNIDAILPDAFNQTDHIFGVRVQSNQEILYSNMAKFPLMNVIADKSYSIVGTAGNNVYTEVAVCNGWYGGVAKLIINDNNNNSAELIFQNGTAPKFIKTTLSGTLDIGYKIVNNVYHIYIRQTAATITAFVTYVAGSIHTINLAELYNYSNTPYTPASASASELTIIS